VLALLLPALAVLGAFGGWAYRHRTDLARAGRGDSRVDEQLLPEIARWAARAHDGPPGLRLALFGDSVAHDAALAGVLARALAARGIAADVASATHRGLQPLHFYYLLDDVLAGRPALVVVEVHVTAFSPLRRRSTVLPELSRRLSLARAWPVRRALADQQVGPFDPPLYRLAHALGVGHVMTGIRTGAQEALNRSARAAETRAHVRSVRHRVATVGTRALSDDPAVLRDDPAVVALRALLTGLRDAGVGALLFVTPMAAEHVADWLVLDAAPLPAKIEALRAACGATPEEWLDLHALLDGDAMRDGMGHLRPAGAERLAAVLAGAVAVRTGSR
jgi:hypothetical protein